MNTSFRAKGAVCATLLLSVSGCGNISNIKSFSTPYTEPASGEVARVRVISDGMVRGVPGRDCVDWRVPGAGVMAVVQSGFASRNGQSLGMPASDLMVDGVELARTELKVPGNQPFAVSYQNRSASCRATFSFTPKAGQDYELILIDSGPCVASVQQLSPGAKATQQAVQKASLCNAMDAI
ncbi:MAG: hypothetical protein WBB95_24685 [Pseudomonas sp.]|uniref:hypothetical protein n=1 Tax=Pseudomonas sp. TaxID=306 RepID=UPI003C749656